MSTLADNQKSSGPKTRDERGRFVPGVSGNRSGRPLKRPAPPWSLVGALMLELAEAFPMRGHDGSPVVTKRDMMVKSLIHGAVKAKPKDLLHVMEWLFKHGAFDPALGEIEDADPFTEEDRRLLAIVQREILPHNCSRCDQPIAPTVTAGPPGHFGLD